MKWLIVLGLCLAVVNALPTNQDAREQQENRRRLQSISLKVVDSRDNDDDDDRSSRYEPSISSRDRSNSDRREDHSVELAQIVKQIREQSSRDRYDSDNDDDSRRDDEDDDDDDSSLKDANVKKLAQNVGLIASRYNGNGVLKVSYRPSSKNVLTANGHDLGSLHFRFVPVNNGPVIVSENRIRDNRSDRRESSSSSNRSKSLRSSDSDTDTLNVLLQQEINRQLRQSIDREDDEDDDSDRQDHDSDDQNDTGNRQDEDDDDY